MAARHRPAPIAGSAVIWRAGLLERWGISYPTLWRWVRAGKIPPPDIQIGGRQGWRPETVAAIERGEATR